MELVKGHQELFNGQLFDIWRNEQHEVFMTTEQLARQIGISESTVAYLTRDNEPQNVKTKVFNAVVSAIAENY